MSQEAHGNTVFFTDWQ